MIPDTFCIFLSWFLNSCTCLFMNINYHYNDDDFGWNFAKKVMPYLLTSNF